MTAEADIDIQNDHGQTTLYSAVSYGHVEILKLFLKPGANVNAESKEGTALHIARERNHVEIVKTLLAAGAI